MKDGRWRGHCWVVALIGAWGAVPLLWFLPGHFIHTTDLEMPIGMARWLAIATTWKSQWGTGAEWSISLPTLVPYLIPAITNWMTGSLFWAQRIEFVAWFLLPGLSMYTLMVYVSKSWAARLVATHLYMFNLALASQWPGGQSALIAYAVFPWVILLIVRGLRAARAWGFYAVALGLLAGAGAGIGVNFAQSYVFVLGLLILIGCYLVAHRGTPEGSPIRCLAFFGIAGAIGFGCNAFWMLPQAVAANMRIADTAIADIKGWTAGWLEGISTNTSLQNVLRMQGDWTWFQGWKEPYVTYAEWYRSHPAFIALSWFPAALALIGCLTTRGWLVGYSAFTMVIGLVLSTGTHPPFRPLYLWCAQHLPLFWIVRSPWFKFTLLTSIGYAILGGLGAGTISRWVQPWWRARIGDRRAGTAAAFAVAAVLIVAHTVYAHPLVLGRMFPKPSERREVTPSHAIIPEPVMQAAAWINRTAPNARFLCLPYRVNGASVYRWGFSGPVPILYYFTDASFLFSSFSWFAADYGNRLAEEFYAALYDRVTPEAVTLLRLLGVQYLLQEDDIAHDYFETRDDDPAFIRQRLRDQTGITPVETVGPRTVYAVSNSRPLVYAADRLVEIVGAHPTLVPLQVKGRSDISEEPGVRSGMLPMALTEHLDGAGALVFPAEASRATAVSLPIHQVVVYNGASLEAAAATALQAETTGLTVFVTPDSFTEDLTEGRLPPTVCRVAEWPALGPLETWPDRTRWRWQTYAVSGQPRAHLDNLTGRSLTTNIQVPIATYRIERDVELFLNGTRLRAERIHPDQPSVVLLRSVTLAPGRNVLSFATPHAAVLRGGENVTYALGDDVRVGTLTLAAVIDLPRAGAYRFQLHPAPWPTDLPEPLAVSLDGQPIPLRYDSPRAGFVGSITAPAAGPHTVRIQHAAVGTRYFLHCSQPGAARAPAPATVTFTRRAPTDVEASVVSQGPCLLVFNESYHPAWEARARDPATGRLRRLPHFLVNGFANGYYLDRVGATLVTFRFALQDLFERGLRISSGVAAVAVVTLLVGLVRLPHRRSR
ncbi:MAG: hypothetical protein HY600_02175 [Candidatus Omnitrophica bacterium]|nr:hypothetical protein [Candidatus Omnitrophota bacterium]